MFLIQKNCNKCQPVIRRGKVDVSMTTLSDAGLYYVERSELCDRFISDKQSEVSNVRN